MYSLWTSRGIAWRALSALLVGVVASMGAAAQTGSLPPERMARGVEMRVNRLALLVDATAEQKDRLTKLAQAAAADMQPLREQHRAAHQQATQLLAAPVVDRAALERLRAQQSALSDTLSKRRLQHQTDVADVLTPAQRSKLAQLMQQRGERRGQPGSGMGMGMSPWG